MFDKLKMLKQAKEMQSKMAEIIIEHEEKGILVKINGKQDVLAIEIQDENLLTNKDNLEYALKEVLNNGIKKAQREAAMQMQGAMGGLF
jgi:DNA-binding protein YbaB